MSPEAARPRRGGVWARALTCAAGIAGALLATAGTAAAGVTGPCRGSVTIEGATYTPANDTAANPILIPESRSGPADWAGGTDFAIHNHKGKAGVKVGPATIEVAAWAGENAEDDTEASGTYLLETAFEKLPLDLVGIYEVVATHEGDEGSCEGTAMVKIPGNPLGTVPGAVSAGGTLLALAGTAGAAFVKKGVA